MKRTLMHVFAIVAMTVALDACAKSKDASTTVIAASEATTVETKGASVAVKDIPIYPGAEETNKMAMSGGDSSGSSYDARVYHSDEKSKAISDWYKDHLGSKWMTIASDTDKGYVATYTFSSENGASEVVTVQPEGAGTTISITAAGDSK